MRKLKDISEHEIGFSMQQWGHLSSHQMQRRFSEGAW